MEWPEMCNKKMFMKEKRRFVLLFLHGSSRSLTQGKLTFAVTSSVKFTKGRIFFTASQYICQSNVERRTRRKKKLEEEQRQQ